MREFRRRGFILYLPFAAGLIVLPQLGFAQQADGPQTSAPPPVAPPQPAAAQTRHHEWIRIPAGTRVAVVLENGISTRSAKPGDSVYFHTSFPITQNNHIVIPVGSYLKGELIESKRPGKSKGAANFACDLDTLIFPNGYTVDLNAAPRSADPAEKRPWIPKGK